MINKDLEQINEADLQALKDNATSEGKTLEYKQQLPGNTDTEKKEFLADVSSFANSSGGDLIFGIVEDGGVPSEIEGVAISDTDQEIQRMENIIRDGIEPRIPSVSIKPISLPNSRTAILIRILTSWCGPHRVVYQGHDRFYARNSSGKYPLDVAELRTAFNMTEAIAERIRRFTIDRVSKTIANENPIELNVGAKIILHLTPMISFRLAQNYDINSIASRYTQMPPISHYGFSNRYNLDGLLVYSADEGQAYSYAQLFRTGIIEAVDSILLSRDNGDLYIPSITYEERLIEAVSNYTSVQKSLNIEPPIFIFLSFIGVRGYRMGVGHGIRPSNVRIDRDVLLLPEVIINSYDFQPTLILKSTFDSVWNACGYSRSLNYNANGEWSPDH